MFQDIQRLIVPVGNAGPNTEDQLRSLESQVGALPPRLRALLAQYGSFMFDESVIAKTPLGDLPVFVFYGATGQNTIQQSLADFDELRERSLVPFADTEFGDRFAYSARNGSIWFEDTTGDLGINKVFPNFDQFLDSIVLDPEGS